MARPPEGCVRKVLIGWGSILLLFGACQLLLPRARYVDSNPRPGAVLESVPNAVSITFSDSLSSDSRIDVYPVIVVSPSGERSRGGGKLLLLSGQDPGDPRGRTLRAATGPGLAAGVYRVQWTAIAARSRAPRFGSFEFAAGTAPDDVTGRVSSELRERDARWRGRRSALVGGVALIALGILFPLLPRKG